MHPILRDRRALVTYLVTWLAASSLPAAVLAAPGERGLLLALAVAAPATLLLGVAALPVYYLCRAIPLRFGDALRVHATVGLAGGAAWLVVLDVTARILDGVAPAGLCDGVEARWGALLAMGAALYLAVAAFYTLASSVQRAHASERRAAAATLRAHQAQLALLKAQIHPHFLFNSLHAIGALTVQDPRQARELCALLGDFLRGSLAMGERGTASLAEELALARAYLDIERIRLGDRLTLDIQVTAPAGEVHVPALLLQPLIVNAVTHGIATCARGGTLAVDARTTPGMLVVTVANPFDPQAPPRRGKGSGGVGLANVSRRIAACYHGATLTTRRDVDRFTSTLVLPIAGEERTDESPAHGLAPGPRRR